MWDYVISRAPISLPKLEQNNKTKLLKPVKQLDLPSDNESDCSSTSEGRQTYPKSAIFIRTTKLPRYSRCF